MTTDIDFIRDLEERVLTAISNRDGWKEAIEELLIGCMNRLMAEKCPYTQYVFNKWSIQYHILTGHLFDTGDAKFATK